jgi:benzoyl-CoA reductase subunit A
MSLLARSGGVKNQLTFSGGVARNDAVVKFLRDAVAEHYGPLEVNVSLDSIFYGAMGAALFARMGAEQRPC